ncbi:MAG: OmpA family protein [Leptospirillia bacterium]
MTNRTTTGNSFCSTLKRLIPIGMGGLLSLALSGCSTHMPMQSMAPGPTVDHGFPGVSVTRNSAQWPTVHGPAQNSEHRIYTEVPPPLPTPISQPTPAPPPGKKPSPHQKIQKTVYFSYNSARLSYWDKVVLNKVAEELRKTPYKLIVLHGSTDPLGSETYNKKLGLWRALSVKHYLIFRKIPAKKIRAFSWGDKKTRLFSSCRRKSPLCHSQSRSVRLDIVR